MTDAGTAWALHLEAQNYGVTAVNLFANGRPSQPDAIIAVSEFSTGELEMMMGGGGPSLANCGLQLIVRGTPDEDYDVVRARIDAIFDYIAAQLDITLSGDRYLHATPQGVPALIEKDDAGRLVFSANFTMTKE